MAGSGPTILIQGAGVAGLVTAVTLAERGAQVTLHEAGPRIGSGASWFAGGMLAPWCEAESAPEEVTRDSLDALAWWSEHVPHVMHNGSLVVAPPRDQAELARFGRRTSISSLWAWTILLHSNLILPGVSRKLFSLPKKVMSIRALRLYVSRNAC